MIEREPYIESERPEVARLLGGAGYTGAGLEREEILRTSADSDNYQDWQRRISHDNGATWDDPVDLPGVNVQLPEGGIATFPGSPFHQNSHAVSPTYRVTMKRLWPGNELYTFDWSTHEHPFHDHVFVQEDDGEPVELRYEDESESQSFDPEDPFNPAFVEYNRAYRGQSVCFSPEGVAYHPMVCRPRGPRYGLTTGGVVLMRRESPRAWHPSNLRFVSGEVSSRGLLEPDAAVLSDGRIMVVCRGSNTDTTAGRKWMTWSEDEGHTLAPVEELRYSDGSRFYSPSSIHRFIRSSKNGRLYWVGNICGAPPSGNSPRYPLYIAEIDEHRMGVVRESLIVIDDRRPDEPESIAFSNFYIVEDRKTLDIEIFMSRHANRRLAPDWISSVYRYRFRPERSV